MIHASVKAALASRLLTLVVLANLLLGCLAAPAPRSLRERHPPQGPLGTLQIGLCEDYPSSSRSLQRARRDLEVCRSTGATTLRISFSWLEMQPTPDAIDFSFWDDFIRMAVDEYHLRLIPYVCYTPRWAASDPGDNYWHSAPRDPEAFARFVTALVTRYRSRIHSWELWNEPDNPAYWTGTVAQFSELVLAGSRAVRAADPSATVVLGGIAWRVGFVAELLQLPGLPEAVDVINMHAYLETWAEDPLEHLPAYIGRVHDLIVAHGGRQRIWLAEVGYSDYRRGSFVSGQYTARFPYEHTPAYQADALLRAAVLAASTGQVDLFTWYRINDLPADIDVIGDVNNRHLGILDVHGQPKPAFTALARAAAFFERPFACIDNQTWVLHPAGAHLQVHAFLDDRGVTRVFAWQQTAVPGETAAGAPLPPAPLPVKVWLPAMRTASSPAAQACPASPTICVTIRARPDHLTAITLPPHGHPAGAALAPLPQ